VSCNPALLEELKQMNHLYGETDSFYRDLMYSIGVINFEYRVVGGTDRFFSVDNPNHLFRADYYYRLKNTYTQDVTEKADYVFVANAAAILVTMRDSIEEGPIGKAYQGKTPTLVIRDDEGNILENANVTFELHATFLYT
jgi:hypothetical protein